MQNRKLSPLFTALLALIITGSCKKSGSDDPCSGVNITLTAVVTNSDGTNGRVNATATGSTGFTYSKDGAAYVASGDFTNLAPATYNITAKDANGCTGTQAFTVAATKTYYITRNTWKFQSATASGFGDVSSFLQACQKDNILTFAGTAGTGTGTLDEGPTKCNAGDPQTSPFTWNFQSNESQLFVSATLFTSGSNTFNLVSVTQTQLVLSQQITVSGIPTTVTVTFIH